MFYLRFFNTIYRFVHLSCKVKFTEDIFTAFKNEKLNKH